MSEACRLSLRKLFGQEVYDKAQVFYPLIHQAVTAVDVSSDVCRFLFVGTQFEIKGGEALLKAFRRVHAQAPNVHLDLITHLPSKFTELAMTCPSVRVYEARFTREEIYTRFMSQADVLILPSYVESFGMVALEALAHGMAIIATDVYALRELVVNSRNGNLLTPPISIWNGVLPSRYYYDLEAIKDRLRSTNMTTFEDALSEAILRFASDHKWRHSARRESVRLMRERFAC